MQLVHDIRSNDAYRVCNLIAVAIPGWCQSGSYIIYYQLM